MNKIYKNQNSGFITLEIVLAFAILLINITGILLLTTSFQGAGTGYIINQGQLVKVNNETNQEFIYKVQEQLEKKKSEARHNFLSIEDENKIEQSGPLSYLKNLDVNDLTPCKKKVKSEISWNTSSLNPQKIEFSTIFVDIAEALALGGDCRAEPSNYNWDNPMTASSTSLGGAGATDLDIKNNYIYLSSSPSASDKDDFYIYEFNPFADPQTLTKKSSINTSAGINAIDYASGYAYVANNEKSNQLIIIDVRDPDSPNIISSTSLPDINTGYGRSIYYYDNKVYIGTQYLACPPSCLPKQNNEFHIYDVTVPNNPQHIGRYNVNHNINDIIVRNEIAFLATSYDLGEIMIFDVSDPTNISLLSIFDAKNIDGTANSKDGWTLELLGNKLYLGRAAASKNNTKERDFYILDVSNPLDPIILGSKNLEMSSSSKVIGIKASGQFAFLGLDNPTVGFRILNISDPSNITDHTVCTSYNYSENSTSLEMEGNYIFTTNRSNDEIRVIKDQDTSCIP